MFTMNKTDEEYSFRGKPCSRRLIPTEKFGTISLNRGFSQMLGIVEEFEERRGMEWSSGSSIFPSFLVKGNGELGRAIGER